MKTRVSLILGLFFLLWAIPSMAMEPVKVRLATFNLGSSWYVYGALMADILRRRRITRRGKKKLVRLQKLRGIGPKVGVSGQRSETAE